MPLFPSSLPQLLIVATVVTLTLALLPRRFSSAFESAFTRFANRRWLAIASIFLLVIAIRVSLLPLLPLPIPGIHDEFSYLLMADTFVHGRLANPPHPMWLSFETFHVNFFPTYSSMYPPAQGLVLALGQLLGHPWIGVLLSDAAMCAVILWMLQAWLPPRWALLGASCIALKLGIASYWMNSYWGGALAAIGGALVLGALPRIIFRRSSAHSAFSSLALGSGLAFLGNSRPYEGFLLCLPAALYVSWWLTAKPRSLPLFRAPLATLLVPLAAVLLPTLLFMGYYNVRLTGNPFLLPHVLNSRTYELTGLFLWDRSAPPIAYHNQQFDDFYNGWERENYTHTWPDLQRVSQEKIRRCASTYLWFGAILLLPGLPCALSDRRTRLPFAILILSAAGIFAVTWSMAHYAAPLTCIIFLFLVQAMRHTRRLFRRILPRRFVAALSWASVALLILQVSSTVSQRRCDPMLWTCDGDPSRQAIVDNLSQTPARHLVLVRYDSDHNFHDEWVYNPADIDAAKVLFARELDPAQNKKLLAYFHDRYIWLVAPDADNTTLSPLAVPDARPATGRPATPPAASE